jgi:hypothetical protein
MTGVSSESVKKRPKLENDSYKGVSSIGELVVSKPITYIMLVLVFVVLGDSMEVT